MTSTKTIETKLLERIRSVIRVNTAQNYDDPNIKVDIEYGLTMALVNKVQLIAAAFAAGHSDAGAAQVWLLAGNLFKLVDEIESKSEGLTPNDRMRVRESLNELRGLIAWLDEVYNDHYPEEHQHYFGDTHAA